MNENWIKTSDLKHMKGTAKKVLESVKAYRSQFTEVYVPDPNRPRLLICKLIKNE